MRKIISLIMVSIFALFVISCENNSSNILGTPETNIQQNNGEALSMQSLAKKSKGMLGINVLLNTSITDEILSELGNYGHVMDKFVKLDAIRIKAKQAELENIRALPFVESANPDAERHGRPVDTVVVEDFTDGLSTWNLDVINVTTGPGFDTRSVDYDGEGVYIGVLDSGLLDSWRSYFADERVAVELAKSFGGGGAGGTNVSEQPNKWEHDQDSHGTHVTSTILGYSLGGTPVNGVAPMATVIPVKVLNQNGSGWSSVVARGIMYMAELKEGPLSGSPVVINMSLGGGALDAIEEEAIDYAISVGVIIVASAGNEGQAGMGYPGAYEPVISVAASGWVGEWTNGCWWNCLDDPDPNVAALYNIADFSSRELLGQDLDVTAPGSWIVGPYQLNSGNSQSYYYLGGTSMASPHVAGLVALMAQKDGSLTGPDAESILTDPSNTLWIPEFTHEDQGSGLVQADLVLD